MIRQATEEDIPQLNQISVAAKMHWGYPQDWLEHWLKDLTVTQDYLTKNYVYKLQIEDKIIGLCAIAEREDEYEIDHLWVLPNFMGNGYGKILLQETMKEVITKPKRIVVVADPNAEDFYQKMGFETFDKIESYPKGRFLPVMRKIKS